MPRDNARAAHLHAGLRSETDPIRLGVRGCMSRTHALAVSVQEEANRFAVLLEEFRVSGFFVHTRDTVARVR